MSLHTCPTCGLDFRKGKRAMVLDQAGQLAPRLVCLQCMTRAVSVVTVTRESVACDVCHDRAATTCRACSNDGAHKAASLILKPFAEYFLKLAKGYDMVRPPEGVSVDTMRGQAEGLVQAAGILERGRAPVSADAANGVNQAIFKRREFKVQIAQIPTLQGRPLVAQLSKAEGSMLVVLAQQGKPMTRKQLGILSGYSFKRSTFRGAIASLRASAYVQGPSDAIVLTADGKAAAPAHETMPVGGRQLLDRWRGQIPTQASRRMLDAFVSFLPHEPTKQELARYLETDPDKSTFRGALGRLRALQLVHGMTLAPELRKAAAS